MKKQMETFRNVAKWYKDLNELITKEMYKSIIREFDEFFSNTAWKISHYDARIDFIDYGTGGILVTFDYRYQKGMLLHGKVLINDEAYKEPLLVTYFEKPNGSRGLEKTFRSLDRFFEEWPEYSNKALNCNYIVDTSPNRCHWNEKPGIGGIYILEVCQESDPPKVTVRGNKQLCMVGDKKEELELDFWKSKISIGGISQVEKYFTAKGL